jgi:hypothetical protein
MTVAQHPTAHLMNQPPTHVNAREATREPQWLEVVRQHVGSLRYGAVQIVVHDARVIQIEKTERVRFDRPRENAY